MDMLVDSQVTFHDYKPKQLSLYTAVLNGFSKPCKSIPPKFFYDKRGSYLFDKICKQPEYYLPNVEKSLLEEVQHEITQHVGKGRVVIEPGAGNLSKIRLLLNQLKPEAYIPMDISSEYLKEASENLAKDFPWLNIHATCVDFTHSMPLPDITSNAPRLAFFPGSSLGNFNKLEAQQFLSMIRETIGDEGMLLIGVDTKKPQKILNAAYNDEAGVTAEFNLNLLHRIQNELEADFELDNFDHYAFYNDIQGRIEMHLVSQCDHNVRIDDQDFYFKDGETLHTENSYKYAPEEFIALSKSAKLGLKNYWLAEDELFAIYLLQSI